MKKTIERKDSVTSEKAPEIWKTGKLGLPD